MNNSLKFSFCHAILSLETTPGIRMQAQSLQRGMLLGSAGAGGQESKRNKYIQRDVCCQLIQDHVLV